MEYKWNDALNIGDEKTDSQHQELVKMFNELLAVCASELNEADKNKQIENSLNFLCLYTVQHFADEEALQIKCGYPNFEAHRAIHEEFKMKAFELCEKFKGWGYSYKFATILRSQIGDWLVSHIQDEDGKIAEYLK